MKYQARDLERMSKSIVVQVEDELNRLGFFFRVFHRCKAVDSTSKKIIDKGYDGQTKFLTDIIGIRINLYFADDVQLVVSILKKMFQFDDETIDQNLETEFKPTRLNILFKIPKAFQQEFEDVIGTDLIKNTFEVQIRTVLSEGWHEVDHDLRYKSPDNWTEHSDLSRMFNGILASLEASDWSILKLFEQLSYRHYKTGLWLAMLKTKLRLRIASDSISQPLKEIVDGDKELQRKFFKVDRNDFMCILMDNAFQLPLTLENTIYLLNYYLVSDERITKITPQAILKEIHH